MSNLESLEKKRTTEVANTDNGDSPDNKRQKLDDGRSAEKTQSKKTFLSSNNESTISEENSKEESSFSRNDKRDNKAADVTTDAPFHKHSEPPAAENMTEINQKEDSENKEDSTVHEMSKKKLSHRKTDCAEEDIVEISPDVRQNADIQLSKKEVSRSDSNDQDDESSPARSEGSEKENVDIKNERSHSPDIIMLSDGEDVSDAVEEGVPLSEVRRLRILKKIKSLQNQLRNEEATLVLLKKLRQSQISHPQDVVQQAPTIRPAPHHQQITQLHMRPHGGPPPLVRSSQSNSRTLQNVSPNSHLRGQQINNQSSRSTQGPPPLVMAPRPGSGHGAALSQSSSHGSRGGPQNLNRGNDSSQQRIQQQQNQQQQQATQRQNVVPQTPAQPQDTQTPAQRQAAAKQALRKQLEKTLLQIPPPKPPPPEMNFIPSLACPDFILLLGLEEVVNHMIDLQLIARGQKNPDERFVCTPFTCVQCGSDFTPVWKREKPGSKNVICEYCVTTNQKKALKQEHTNRLKSAFVKALQQEQEIERMQASSTPTPQQPSSSTPQPQHPSASMISAASAAAAAANAAAAAAVASYRPSADQLRQHHSFFQQAQLRAGQPLGLQAFSRAPFPYNIPFANQQDLQRQYLLDMIPRGGMPWKQ